MSFEKRPPRFDDKNSLPEETSKKTEQEKSEAVAEQEAIDYLYRTIGQEPNSIESFPEKLFAEIEQLPRFQEALNSLEGVKQEDVPLTLFNILQPREGEHGEHNGVLIDSMKSGALHCAGRASIGSRILSKLGMDHYYAMPPGHSMLILNLSPDTLGYFDANNNIYFTFPKEALTGFTEGPLSECRLQNYQARDSDSFVGDGSVMHHMMLTDGNAGILHSYLGNTGAALSGHSAFIHDSIPQNKAAADAISDIKKQLLGDALIPDSYFIEGEREQEQQKIKDIQLKEKVLAIEQTAGSKSEFIAELIDSKELWSKFPYRQSTEQKAEYLERLYERVKK